MALFENFPYTNLHELNLDWVIKEIEDLKEGQVLSVNGQTGDVILYQDNDILFPAVTDSHWSMVRSADGTTRGIMFGNDNKAYIVHGSTMEQLYSASNQPPYPVESVNGKTGAVTLFTDNNGVVSFPAVTDPNIEGIIIGRTLNNKPVYIQINDDGTIGVTAGVNSNEIYTTADTDKNVFPVPEAGTTETGTNNKQWGVVREVNSGDIGLLFNLGETPEVYIRYRDPGLSWQNIKLLTNDDIPSSSGVVSFNGETGVITADGSTLDVSDTDTRTIEEALGDIEDKIKGFYADNTLNTTLAELINKISPRSTGSIGMYRCSADVMTILRGATVAHSGIVITQKASSNNAYFYAIDRDRINFGNISISNGNVSITHELVRTDNEMLLHLQQEYNRMAMYKTQDFTYENVNYKAFQVFYNFNGSLQWEGLRTSDDVWVRFGNIS